MKRSVLILLASVLCLQALSVARTTGNAQTSESKTIKAKPLPLDCVRLTGGPLKHAQDLDGEYLLQLQPERMLAFLRRSAGLKPKAQGYGGWDGEGRQLTGHIAGHYLSGVSLMYAATGDDRYKVRADYIVAALKEIQDAQKDGYLGALQAEGGIDGKQRFQDLSKGVIKSSGFDLNGLWSPWYVQHKIFAGLRDAYRYTGNRTALEVETKFAAWAESVLSPLSDDQIQHMLETEFGGMNEVLADLYADTADKRWLTLSYKFEHRAIVEPLAAHKDVLAGKHGNTQIPKMIGSLSRYVYTGNETDRSAAGYFWDEVAAHHTFATGGHSKNEYFGAPGKLDDMVDGRTAETCNVYNMLKLSRMLFSVDPQIRYADFHERALFNHILASQDPDDGRVTYMLPVGRGVQHEYQDKFESFTCCVGTGMESHALHGYGIYYESANTLWVGLYAPSIAKWKTNGVTLETTTDLPFGESASLKFAVVHPTRFTLELRRPSWAGKGFVVRVNGLAIEKVPGPDSFVQISREWKTGDTVELTLPKTLRKEPLPDNPNRMAFMWGPLALAGDLGPEIEEENWAKAEAPPAFVTSEAEVDRWLVPVPGKPGSFRTHNIGLKKEIEFVPFYELPRRRYAIYWDVFSPAEWEKKSHGYMAEQERIKKLESITVSFAQPGQMQSERDFAQQGEDTMPIQVEGRYGRAAKKWFSFDLPVDGSHPMGLVVTYSDEARKECSFDVLVNGKKVGEQTIEHRSPEKTIHFFDVKYSMPAETLQGAGKITVRFEAKQGTYIPGVFGIRVVRLER